jgi:hypothetical protein
MLEGSDILFTQASKYPKGAPNDPEGESTPVNNFARSPGGLSSVTFMRVDDPESFTIPRQKMTRVAHETRHEGGSTASIYGIAHHAWA